MAKRRAGGAWRGPLSMAGLFMGGGALLFMHVWWPIQAERSLVRLRHVENQIFQKKSELRALHQRYSNLTSLAALDEWAKNNGPWRSPRPHDIVTITP